MTVLLKFLHDTRYIAPKIPKGIRISLQNHFSPTGNSKKPSFASVKRVKFSSKLNQKSKITISRVRNPL